MSVSYDFSGRTVLVTGAARGIGLALSQFFAAAGANLAMADVDEAALGELSTGDLANAVPVVMDVSDADAVAGAVTHIVEKTGRLDVVVNNAGGQFSSPAVDISPKGWAAVVETNLYGTWYVMQAAARRWVAEGQAGNIVNISTIQGRASVGIPHTAASRAGGVALTRSLAVEWAPHRIRVNSIAVGVIAREGLKTYPPEARASFGHNPMRRLGDVWDVAQGAAYLAGPTGDFVTGTHLEITGGEHVWGEYWPLGKPDYFQLDEDAGI